MESKKNSPGELVFTSPVIACDMHCGKPAGEISQFWDTEPIATITITKVGKHVTIWFDALRQGIKKYDSTKGYREATAQGIKFKNHLPKGFAPAEAFDLPVKLVGFQEGLSYGMASPLWIKVNIDVDGSVWFWGVGGKFWTRCDSNGYYAPIGYRPFVCMYDAMTAESPKDISAETAGELKKQLSDLGAIVTRQATIIAELQAKVADLTKASRAEGEPGEPG